MRKENRGITLVSLVVTIIVLLILAMVSVNAIVGENGIIARAMESRFLSILSDIMFNIEDDVVDINIENISSGKKLISTEMLYKLIERKTLTSSEDTKFLFSSSSIMQANINDKRLSGLTIGYNGDIWYDNYKRGKIQLSSQVDEIVSENKNAKITVIDGTIEEYHPNVDYILHSLKDRDDFACWVNEYGEIISQYPDTIIYSTVPIEREYTAIYDKQLRDDILKLNDKVLIGFDMIMLKGSDNKYYYEEQVTHCQYSHYYLLNYSGGSSVSQDDIVEHKGVKISVLGIAISPYYDKLMLNDDGKIEKDDDVVMFGSSTKREDGDISWSNFKVPEELRNFFIKVNMKDENDVVKSYPCVISYDDLKLTSRYSAADLFDDNGLIEEAIKNYKEKGFKKIYYRGYINYVELVMDPLELNYFTWSDGAENSYYEPAIKSMDL